MKTNHEEELNELREKRLEALSDDMAELMEGFKFNPLGEKGTRWSIRNDVGKLSWVFTVDTTELALMVNPYKYICEEIQKRQLELHGMEGE